MYLNYTDEMCKVKEHRGMIGLKAVKNCPGERDFWLGYLRELESNPDDYDSEKL